MASRFISIFRQSIDEGDRALFAGSQIEAINEPGCEHFGGARPAALKRVGCAANRFAHDRSTILVDGTRVVDLTRRVGRVPRSYAFGYSAVEGEFDLSVASHLLFV